MIEICKSIATGIFWMTAAALAVFFVVYLVLTVIIKTAEYFSRHDH